MTGRYAIRSGTHTVPRDGGSQGLVAWERTIGDVLSEAGYATACFGKWHLGAEDGRWPTDHGFDEWYGPPRSYDESRWDENPWYRPGPRSAVVHARGACTSRRISPASHQAWISALRSASSWKEEFTLEARKRGAKAVVKRDVVRLVTPGTLAEEALDAKARDYRRRSTGETQP